MKNDLTCELVRDLLPNFVEGLTSPETSAAVERHLAECSDCAARREAMSAPTEASALTLVAKEVDYLKGVKKHNMRRIFLSVFCTVIVLLGILALKVFVIGTPLQPQMVAVTGEETQDGLLTLSIASIGSGDAFHSWTVETRDGIASIYARDVLVSALYSDGTASVPVPLEGVREVWLGGISGRLVWQDGIVITQKTSALLDAKTPYAGDASAFGRIASLLNLQERAGNYTVSMHTSSEPYSWTIHFSNTLDDSQYRAVVAAGCQILALVENLSAVSWTEANGAGPVGTLTLEDAARTLQEMTRTYNTAHLTDWTVEDSIKDYAASPAAFQRLTAILENNS